MWRFCWFQACTAQQNAILRVHWSSVQKLEPLILVEQHKCITQTKYRHENKYSCVLPVSSKHSCVLLRSQITKKLQSTMAEIVFQVPSGVVTGGLTGGIFMGLLTGVSSAAPGVTEMWFTIVVKIKYPW